MLPREYCNIEYKSNIEHWDEGLPLGNGDTGCLIWGNGGRLRLSIDKNSLWDCSGAVTAQGDFTYKALQRFVKQKRKRKISKVFDAPYANPTPTKLPAGKIMICVGDKNIQRAYLDISCARAEIDTENTHIESFIHAKKSIGFIRADRALDIRIENPDYGKKEEKKRSRFKPAITQSLKNLKYESAQTACETAGGIRFQYFTQKVNDKLTYGIFTAVFKNEAAYTVSIAANKDDAVKDALLLLREALKAGYDKNFSEHKKWWDQFWNESHIDLPDKYLEKKWYMTNYLLGSCSREGFAPMPLQGVWTADNGRLPPWKGDYHFDLNVQLCYLSYLKANHLSCGKSYIDFLLNNEKKAEKFARDFYGAKGLCLPSVMDIKGNALGGWAMYALSPTNQAWLCHGIMQYCDYSADDDLLLSRAYPYMKKYGEFLLSVLTEDKDGNLVLPLSSSPETHDNTLRSWLKPNSNYDNAMLIRHFKNLFDIAERYDMTADKEKWQSVLHKLQPLAVSNDNVLMLSQNEKQTHSHRHFSHLISIYPLELLQYKGKNKEIIDASVKDLENLGSKEYCGYSFAWLANLYAVQKRGADAAETLTSFWRNFCLPNVFHVNGDYKKSGKSAITYRIFTLEGNFCAADALQNMLMQCRGDQIELFPALPDKWQDISFDLLACGNVRVSACMKNGALEVIRLCSAKSRKIHLIYKNRSKEIRLTENEIITLGVNDLS